VSLLTTTAQLFDLDTPFSYRRLRTLTAFAEAYVLHRGLTAIGPVADREQERVGRFLWQLNGRRPGVAQVLDGADLDLVRSPHVEARLRDLTDRVLGGRVYVSASGLLEKTERARGSDDDDRDFRRDFVGALRAPDRASALSDLVVTTYRSKAGSGLGQHLLRAFLYAAIAAEAGGSVIFTGNRQVAGLLMYLANPSLLPETSALRTYRTLNAVAYSAQEEVDPLSLDASFRVPLILWDVLRALETSQEKSQPAWRLKRFLDALDDTREKWQPYLRYMDGFDRELRRAATAPATGERRRRLQLDAAANAARSAAPKSGQTLRLFRELLSTPEVLLKTGGGGESGGDSSPGSLEVKLPVRIVFNAVFRWAPRPRRRALAYPISRVIEVYRTNRPCLTAYRAFNIPTSVREDREVPSDREDIEAFEALSAADASARLADAR
jgi:hypothetical protein